MVSFALSLMGFSWGCCIEGHGPAYSNRMQPMRVRIQIESIFRSGGLCPARREVGDMPTTSKAKGPAKAKAPRAKAKAPPKAKAATVNTVIEADDAMRSWLARGTTLVGAVRSAEGSLAVAQVTVGAFLLTTPGDADGVAALAEATGYSVASLKTWRVVATRFGIKWDGESGSVVWPETEGLTVERFQAEPFSVWLEAARALGRKPSAKAALSAVKDPRAAAAGRAARKSARAAATRAAAPETKLVAIQVEAWLAADFKAAMLKGESETAALSRILRLAREGQKALADRARGKEAEAVAAAAEAKRAAERPPTASA